MEKRPKTRTAFDRPKVLQAVDMPGKTKSDMKQECDINAIMAKYQRQGVIAHIERRSPSYGIHNGLDFQEAMQLIDNAKESFAELPSSIRKKFNNSPADFMDFVSNPDNLDELERMGLVTVEEVMGTEAPKTENSETKEVKESEPEKTD